MFEDPNAGGGSPTSDPPIGTGDSTTSDPPASTGGGDSDTSGFGEPTGYQPDSDPVSAPPSSMGTVESDPPVGAGG